MSDPEEDEAMQSEDTNTYSDSEDDDEAEDPALPSEMREITFGALAEAQDSLHPTSHNRSNHDRHSSTNTTSAETLRAHLAELKSLKSSKSTTDPANTAPRTKIEQHEHRSSKHAPREQSSKYQVTRKRPVTDLPANPLGSRDPRFSSITTAQASIDPNKLAAAYSFLSSYRDSELDVLKSNLSALKMRAKKRKSKSMMPEEEEEAESLKRQINSLENRKKTDERKEKEREVVQRHKREEREKVKVGKNPYFLKRGEAKRTAERERFESLKGREKRKLTERREKKKSMRERKLGRAVEGGLGGEMGAGR